MKTLLNALKNLKKDKKGFTLIEIVIVIVIIAILAAMLVPSMLKWVNSANEKSFLSAADTIRTAVNSTISENYAAGKGIQSSGADAMPADSITAIGDLASTTVSTTSVPDKGYKISWTISNNAVTELVVTNAKYTSTWSATTGNWTDVASVAAGS